MEYGGGQAGSQREWEALELDGGPLVPGVDYEGEWLRARAVAQKLNTSFARLGVARRQMRAQADWAADGSGLVHIRLDTLTARELALLLDLLAGLGHAA